MRALGRVHLWPGGSLWIGRGQGRTDRHGHHAHQITLPLHGTCRFRREADGDWTDFAAAFVPSERLHQFEMEDLAEAAHEAGFADSARLSRTFRRMFGMNPATLVRG
jgi:AraC family transcriptional regulator